VIRDRRFAPPTSPLLAFGLNRRTVESLQAQEQQARFALAATHITLSLRGVKSTNVAAAAIQCIR
jgi:hypothetical protein